MNYYLHVLKNYANFSGRARRAEYWYFVLFNTIFLFTLVLIGTLIKFPGLIGIYYIGTIIPLLAVAVRRMHDTDKSGWFILIPIYSFILLLTEGTKGSNEYGADPKNPTSEGVNNGTLDGNIS